MVSHTHPGIQEIERLLQTGGRFFRLLFVVRAFFILAVAIFLVIVAARVLKVIAVGWEGIWYFVPHVVLLVFCTAAIEWAMKRIFFVKRWP